MKDDQVLLPEYLDRVIDLVERTHSRRQDDRLALGADVPEKRVIGERRRRNLVERRIESVDEVDRSLVPTRCRPRDPRLSTVLVDRGVVAFAELEAAFQVAVGVAERRFTRLRQLFRGVHNIDRALLELHYFATGLRRDVDELLGGIEVAVVVDADLRDNKARVAVTDGPFSQHDLHQACSPGA